MIMSKLSLIELGMYLSPYKRLCFFILVEICFVIVQSAINRRSKVK